MHLLPNSIGFTSFTEIKMEIEELQGSSKGSTALRGSHLDLLMLCNSEVRQLVMRACLLPAFPPYHPTKQLEA